MKPEIQEGLGLVLAAAGAGRRFGGDLPKQFLSWRGRPLFVAGLEPFVGLIETAVVVVPPDRVESSREEIGEFPLSVTVVAGGGTRQESVSRGLDHLGPKTGWVLVHDAVRPFVSRELILSVFQETVRTGACVPLLPLRDTVKRVEEGFVRETLDRERLGLAQTPQGFRVDWLLQAVQEAEKAGYQGTDESSLLERIGLPVGSVAGEERNVKLTWPTDRSKLDEEGN